MNTLSEDEILMILRRLPVIYILHSRCVCKRLVMIVDHLTQEEWKQLYFRQVCDKLFVGTGFDWRQAAIRASMNTPLVNALCVWKNLYVNVLVPWNNACLRDGVVRLVSRNSIDFVYNNTFSLRGMTRACASQGTTLCSNCATRSKQKCLNLQYEYYLRPSVEDLTTLDECLSLYIGSHENAKRQYVGDRDRKDGGASAVSDDDGGELRMSSQICWVDNDRRDS